MDNDNKINISKPEVKLFLGDKIITPDLSSASSYNIEEEFAKAKNNRSYKVPLILIGMGIFVVVFSILFTRYVKIQNEKMKVSVESFDDLNLRRLLDSVSRIENELSLAMAEKKQIPLRLNAKLYDAIAAWAEDDFRSVNGQIEYLLTECVRQRKKNGKYVSEHLDEPPELDL